MSTIIREPIDINPSSDFLLIVHGSAVLLQALTARGEEWIGLNLELDEAEFFERALCITSYADSIRERIREDGLVITNHHRTIN